MGSSHNDDTRQGITKTLLFASFEAGRCGKHSYCKDIRLTCPLAVGICLPSVAHGSYCVRFWPTRRDTEEGNEDRIPRAAIRVRPHPCQHQHPTLPTWRPVSPFLEVCCPPHINFTIYCLLRVWCLIISGRRHNFLHQEPEQRDTNVRLYLMAWSTGNNCIKINYGFKLFIL